MDIPIYGTDEVADVTGAGDTVVATFTAALASGATAEEAAHLANYAGGIVVMKRGTATVSQQEFWTRSRKRRRSHTSTEPIFVHTSICSHNHLGTSIHSKIVSREELQRRVADWPRRRSYHAG